MSDELLPKSERRALRYDFTAKETHDLSIQLANETRKLAAIEEEKSSIASQYAAKVKESKATCNKLSNLVADGYELRDIECEIQYHKPQQGKKTIIRKDSNKVTAIEAMTEWEWNLFNQPQDEDDNEQTAGKKGGKKGSKKRSTKGKKKKQVDQLHQDDIDEMHQAIDQAVDELLADGELELVDTDKGQQQEDTEDWDLMDDNDDNEEETQD